MPRPSLLKDLLQRNSEASGYDAPKALSSKRGVKSQADTKSLSGTIRSVRSIAGSIASFYSLVGGGSKIPKRRRSDISRLGVPKFYPKNPKPPEDMPGVKYLNTEELGPYTAAHAKSFSSLGAPGKPWGSIVLYSHASAEDELPVYHGRARVQGELRLRVDEPIKISSVDVWLVARQECILDVAGTLFVNATANLWDPELGDPAQQGVPGLEPAVPFKGTFTPGTYVFPFDFPALPRDVEVVSQKEKMKKYTRCLLPCSHEVSETAGWVGWQRYMVGVYIKKAGVDDEWDMKFEYLPRTRPLPRPESPFPFLALKEDWPFIREEVGGWLLTPFGGRGRLKDTLVEIEGLLGVQAPVVAYPGQVLKFSLLLWSMNREAVQVLARPEHIQVDYMRVDLFGLDVLEPHNSARKHRRMLPMQKGKVWLLDNIPKETTLVAKTFAEKSKPKAKPARSIGMPRQEPVKRRVFVPKRFQQLYNAEAADEVPSDPIAAVQDGPDSQSKSKAQIKDVTEAQKLREMWLKETQEVAHLELTTSTGASLGENMVLDSMSSLTLESNPPQSPALDFLPGSPSAVLSPTDTLPPSPNAATTSFPILEEPVPTSLPSNDDRAPSPTGSFEDGDEDAVEDGTAGHFVRLDGDVLVPVSIPPNYRYLYSGIEYALHLLITHPDYVHISPRATGIIGESPLYVTTDPPLRHSNETSDPWGPVDAQRIPKAGQAIAIPDDAHRFASVRGDATMAKKPTRVSDRQWAFL